MKKKERKKEVKQYGESAVKSIKRREKLLETKRRRRRRFIINLQNHPPSSKKKDKTTHKLFSGCSDYHISSLLLTICSVGVLGSSFLIRFRSALVTSEGVIGMQGVNG